MRIKIGETATASLAVDILYRCSACGKDNLAIGRIKGSSYTPTVMGVNVDYDVSGSAEKTLWENYATVLDPNNPHRFRKAGFVCRCKNCGYAEPWARMNYDHLETPKKVGVITAVLSGIMLMAGLTAAPFGFMHFIFLAFFAMSIATCCGIRIYKRKNNENMEYLIAALPQESLPDIHTHTKERYDAFNQGITSHPT